DKTAPYPGVLDLLDELKDAGVKLAIASNKFEDAVEALCPIYFGDRFHIAVGASDRAAKKPAPDMALNAMTALGASPDRTVYVGDSDVDVETARNAGLSCICVTWGFRDRPFLTEHGASVFVDSTAELKKILL
ncbi:MAG: HAD family hydrolase, partial [Clostridia bacterium]|nr:HAD family hydrolase [Clostridia bacterium]